MRHPTYHPEMQEEFESSSEFYEFEDEVNRKSKNYIKWIQSSLNKIMGFRLVVDGIIGPKTRSAIRSFQSRKGLSVDGIVGPNTEAALIRAGAVQPPGSGAGTPSPGTTPPVVSPSPGSGSQVSGRLRNNLVNTAILQWNTWGNGSKKETDLNMDKVIKRYWEEGVGIAFPGVSTAWSAAFISWVVKEAGGGANFRYSGAHTTYTYYAKQNRLQNNTNPFKAYRITEKKPEPGDIIVQNRGSSAFTYDNLQPDRSGTHGDIVVKINASTIEVLGGNLSDSVSKNTYNLNSNGFLNTAHFAIIKIEETSSQSEWEEEFELIPELLTEIPASLTSGTSAEHQKVKIAIMNGQRNENVLSDMIFFERHPELGRKPLYKGQPGFTVLSKEWLLIRDNIVRADLRSVKSLPPLNALEQTEFKKLSPATQSQFLILRKFISEYSGVSFKEAEVASRILLRKGLFLVRKDLLTLLINLANLPNLPTGFNPVTAKPLLVGNVLYNLAFPETINQGGPDRLGGSGDLTCFSASTQMLLAIRFPSTYVRYVNQLASTSSCTFAGTDSIGPLTFVSTSLYKSLDSVLLQTAFDSYFKTKARSGSYTPGDELKVHRQVFGINYPPKKVTWGSNKINAFRSAFVKGSARKPELINLCVGNPSPCTANHSVVLTRVVKNRVYFYNPWPNERERNEMFGSAVVTISGHGERTAESSMSQADFEGQITTVFHN